jgi:hypothetical protein
VLVVSEIAANAVLHSQSSGEFFTVRCGRYIPLAEGDRVLPTLTI